MNNLKTTIKQLLENLFPPYYVTKDTRTKGGLDARIVTLTDETSYVAEQYKILRTNLYALSASLENPIKTVLITSSVPQDGKSITAANLGAAISLDKEKKVLLIDADLRKPTIHTLFEIPRAPGFSNLLNGSANIESFSIKPTIGNLYVVPSGDPLTNPSEILIYSKVKEIISKLKSRFDYIILDAPPIFNVTDALSLSSLCDAVLLVVKAGGTSRKAVEEAFDILKNAQAKPKACILTNHRSRQRYYYRKSYLENQT